jgi:hypothetical protein
MEKLTYENILTNVTLHQIDSTSLHLLFQRNFTLKNVINYQDFLYGKQTDDISKKNSRRIMTTMV